MILWQGDQIWRAFGWAAEGRAAHGGGETEKADAEEESRVRLPDPAGEDGAAAPGAPGTCRWRSRGLSWGQLTFSGGHVLAN